MKVSVIPIVIDAFGTIYKGLVKIFEELIIKGQVETIKDSKLLISSRIVASFLET